jgi:thiol:disulfide interchange protein
MVMSKVLAVVCAVLLALALSGLSWGLYASGEAKVQSARSSALEAQLRAAEEHSRLIQEHAVTDATQSTQRSVLRERTAKVVTKLKKERENAQASSVLVDTAELARLRELAGAINADIAAAGSVPGSAEVPPGT